MLRARYFNEEGSALSLAIFRVVLFGTIAWFSATAFDLPWFVSLPEVLRTPPPLTGWYAQLPMTPDAVAVGRVALVLSAIAACVGWNTRFAATTATVLGVLLLGIPQLYSKVDHYHHLAWFAAIMAVSPCGDALSVDAWRHRRHPAPPRAYALPLRFVWLLMGCIYFFPGLAKASALPGWVAPDNLRFHLYRKWSEFDAFTPILPIDQWPVILSLSAAFTIAFEISFVWLILHQRTRWIAACSGVVFHQMTGAMMGIPFLHLQVCYVSFVPWERLAVWLRSHRVPTPTIRRSSRLDTAGAADIQVATQHSTRLTSRVGLFLLVTAVLAGFTRLNSWPFAHYPLFGNISGPMVARAELVPHAAGGAPIPISPKAVTQLKGQLNEARWDAILARLAVTQDPGTRDHMAQAVMVLLIQQDPGLRDAATVDVYRTVRSLDPSERGMPPKTRAFLARVPLHEHILAAPDEDARHD